MSRLLKQETVVLIRKGGVSTYDEAGQAVPVDDKDGLKIECNIQPMPGNEILQLPESDREKKVLVMYSECKILGKDKINRFPQKDEQESFEALKDADWTNYPDLRSTAHYRSFLVKIED